ncbi:ABC transporter permease [Chitinophaga sp.]|uniref:ABC transporter permease n=1 Tax=Chitinophaga sp. TaxID=1869181 RepID=UPI00260DE2A4|nr:ABC transporter permease [uncultured Chitinophaga sp.]
MWKIQLLTAWRRLKNNKPYAIINIAGLGASLACAILLFLFINYHLRFDNFHPGSDRIFRISSRTMYGGVEDFNEGVPQPLGKALRNDYTFFEKVAMRISLGRRLITVQQGKEKHKFNGTASYVEPSYFDIFRFPLISGNAHQALSEPYSAIITEEMAAKLFPGQDPIGKQLRLANSQDFTVRGIAQNMPANTDLPSDLFLSYAAYKDVSPYMASDSSWGSIASSIRCYVKLKPGVGPDLVEAAFPQVINKYEPEENNLMFFHMQPLRDLHFDTRYSGSIQRKYLWSLGWMGAFLVLTACINFINLSTAQSLRRTREIGVRKALGGTKRQIFSQFLSETFYIVAAALAIAVTIVSLAIPQLNKTLFTDITLDGRTVFTLLIYICILLLTVVFLAGYYPGILQAKLSPVLAMRAHGTPERPGRFPLRKTLIILQFAIMQFMIVGTIIIGRQMHYSMTGDTALQKEGILLVNVPGQDPSVLKTLRTRITQLAGVQQASFCQAAPISFTNRATAMRFGARDDDEDWQVSVKYADAEYLETFGIRLVAGHNLPASDTANGMLVNETLMRKLGARSPDEIIGQPIRVSNVQTTVRGVFKDFHNHSFHSEVEPLCLYTDIREFDELAIRLNMLQASTVMPAIDKIWNETFPDYMYRFRFLEEDVAGMYEAESLLMQLVEIFAIVAVLIGCLGLYGLISFMAVQKKKEIGVRKVLGASVPSVVWLFGREFTWMLFAGFLLSAPLSWWLMNNWLEGFHYRIDIGPETYAISIVLSAVITVLTVGYTSLRSALMNPAVSLKTE